MIPVLALTVALVAAVGTSFFQASPGELGKEFLAAQRQMATGDFEGSVASYRRLVATPANLLLRPQQVQVTVGDEALPLTAAATYQIASSFRRRGEEGLEAEGDSTKEGARDDLVRASGEYAALWDDPTAPETLRERASFQVADCLFKAGRHEEAIAAFGRFAEAFPESKYLSEARYRTAWARYRNNEWEAAATLYEEVAAAEPGSERGNRSLFQAGEAYERLEQPERALAAFLRLAERFDPTPYEGKRRVREVMHLLRENLSATQRELIGKAHVRAADAYAGLDSLEAALRWYDLAATRFPTEEDLVKSARVRRAEALLRAGRQEEAMAAYRLALEAVSKPLFRAQIQADLMGLLYESRQYLNAASAYGFYCEAFPAEAQAAGVTVEQAQLLRAESLRLAASEVGEATTRDSLLVVSRDEYMDLLAAEPADSMASEAMLGAALCEGELGEDEASLALLERAWGEYGDTRAGMWGLLLAARHHTDRGDTTRALVAYDELTATATGEAADLGRLELAQLLQRRGQSDEAVACLAAVDTTSSEYGRAQVMLADLYGQCGDWELARQVLERTTRPDTDPEVAADLGYMRARLAFRRREYGQTLELLATVDTTFLKAPAATERLYLRGVAHWETGQPREAARDLEAFVATRPEVRARGEALRLLALALRESGDVEGAAMHLESLRAGSGAQDMKEVWRLALGRLWYEAGEHGKAVEALAQVPQDEVLAAEARLVLAEAHMALGEWEQTLAVLEPCDPQALSEGDGERRLLLLGVAAMNAAYYGVAVEHLRGLVETGGESQAAEAGQLHLGQSLYALGENEEAVTVLLDLARRGPETDRGAEAAYIAGENLYVLGRFEEAAAAYRQVTVGKWQAPAAVAEAWCALELGEEDELLRLVQAVQVRFPETPEARQAAKLAGDYQYNKQDYPAARRAYEQVLARYPDSEEAEVARRLLVDLEDLEADLVYQAAMAAFDLGQLDQASRLLKEIIERYPGTLSEMAARCNLGVYYERTGKWHAAMAVYEQVLEVAGEDVAFGDMVEFARDHRQWISEYRL